MPGKICRLALSWGSTLVRGDSHAKAANASSIILRIKLWVQAFFIRLCCVTKRPRKASLQNWIYYSRSFLAGWHDFLKNGISQSHHSWQRKCLVSMTKRYLPCICTFLIQAKLWSCLEGNYMALVCWTLALKLSQWKTLNYWPLFIT